MWGNKYIVYKDRSGLEHMVVFDKVLTHSDVARKFAMRENVVSAGFFGFSGIGHRDGSCYGRSESLRLESRPEEDTALLHKLLFEG